MNPWVIPFLLCSGDYLIFKLLHIYNSTAYVLCNTRIYPQVIVPSKLVCYYCAQIGDASEEVIFAGDNSRVSRRSRRWVLLAPKSGRETVKDIKSKAKRGGKTISDKLGKFRK